MRKSYPGQADIPSNKFSIDSNGLLVMELGLRKLVGIVVGISKPMMELVA
jgi:hypothetical protein